MSEFREHIAKAVAIGAIGTAVLSAEGCSAFTSDTQTPIDRCYSTPLPSEYQPAAPLPEPKLPNFSKYVTDRAFEKAYASYQRQEAAYQVSLDPYSLPALKEPTTKPDSFIKNDPIADEGIINKTTAAIVEVSTSEWKGTGFLTTDAHGDEVVVTAAHVAGDTTAQKLTLETDDNEKTHPVGGCYIYENKGKFAKITDREGKPVEHDIAVLRLAKPIGHSTLTIRQQPAKRGEWGYFVNYQANHEPGDPASYSGLVLSTANNIQGYNILTGLERQPVPVTIGNINDTEVQPGASGGPIVDAQTGEVIGDSTSADKKGYSQDDPGILKTLYNVTFPGAKFGLKNGRVPNMSGAMSTNLMNTALQAPDA